MSTRMTERDWELALEAFRGYLPRRGAKGRDDLRVDQLRLELDQRVLLGRSRAVSRRRGH